PHRIRSARCGTASLVVERGGRLFQGCAWGHRGVLQDQAGGDMKDKKGRGNDRKQHVLAWRGDLKRRICIRRPVSDRHVHHPQFFLSHRPVRTGRSGRDIVQELAAPGGAASDAALQAAMRTDSSLLARFEKWRALKKRYSSKTTRVSSSKLR